MAGNKTFKLTGHWGGAGRMAFEALINPILGAGSINERTASNVAIALALLEVAQAIREGQGK